MKRRELLAAGLVLPWPSQALADEASDPERAATIARRVQAVYAKSRSFRARFRISFAGGPYNRAGATGSVVFQKPDRASWRFANGNRVLCDASVVKVYVPESAQLYEVTPAQSQFPTILSFLNGALEGEFRLGLVHAFKYPHGNVIGGLALRPTLARERAFFAVHARTSLVESVTVVDGAGNRVRYSFSEVRLNAPVSAAELALVTPPATEVVLWTPDGANKIH